MIRKLKRRFIIVTMISVFLVLSVIVIIINILNYSHVTDFSNEILETLIENDGKFGEIVKPVEPGEKPENDFYIETPFETRFFSIRIFKDGTYMLDLRQIAAINEENAVEMANIILENEEVKGYDGIYRYMAKYTEDYAFIVFVDCKRLLDNEGS